MAQARAAIGGEVAVNGEFYKGGKFIATTEKPKSKKAPKKEGKQQFEPYKWAVGEEGKFAIFGKLVGSYAEYIDRYNPSLGIKPSVAGCAYYGDTFRGYTVAQLCEMYNAGQRWA